MLHLKAEHIGFYQREVFTNESISIALRQAQCNAAKLFILGKYAQDQFDLDDQASKEVYLNIPDHRHSHQCNYLGPYPELDNK